MARPSSVKWSEKGCVFEHLTWCDLGGLWPYFVLGEPRGIRTHDTLIKSQVLFL